MISYGENQERIEIFYCGDCFYKLIEIRDPEINELDEEWNG
jgi:hypothetical protein